MMKNDIKNYYNQSKQLIKNYEKIKQDIIQLIEDSFEKKLIKDLFNFQIYDENYFRFDIVWRSQDERRRINIDELIRFKYALNNLDFEISYIAILPDNNGFRYWVY